MRARLCAPRSKLVNVGKMKSRQCSTDDRGQGKREFRVGESSFPPLGNPTSRFVERQQDLESSRMRRVSRLCANIRGLTAAVGCDSAGGAGAAALPLAAQVVRWPGKRRNPSRSGRLDVAVQTSAGPERRSSRRGARLKQ